MKNLIYIIFIIPHCLVSLNAIGQKEHNNWHFGDSCAITFNRSNVTKLKSSAINAIESNATISDSLGNLLFYTNGNTIWDTTNSVMQNGNGLLGSATTTQGSAILQDPSNKHLYYVFTLEAIDLDNNNSN